LQRDRDTVISRLVDLLLISIKLLHLDLAEAHDEDAINLLGLGSDSLETTVLLQGFVVLFVELEVVVTTWLRGVYLGGRGS
jgi:hypothetical protein